MKYKIWDVVRVKKDLKVWDYKKENWDKLEFMPEMLEYRWKKWKIIEIQYWDYMIEWMWALWFADEMLEPEYKEWEYVLVSNNNKKWVKKIFFRTFNNWYWVIWYWYEEEYLKWDFFDTAIYEYIKPLEEIKREIICTDKEWKEIQKILKLNKK
jgi:hypothetical protein